MRRFVAALLLFALSVSSVLAQAITEFSAGITPGAHPLAIVLGPDGNLWFTEPDIDRIGRITPAGIVTEFSTGITPGAGPRDITLGSDGNLWFTESFTASPVKRVGRITPAGIVTEFNPGTASADGIVTGDDGNVWFGSGLGHVARMTPSGVITEFDAFVTPQTILTALTHGPDNVWVAGIGPSIASGRGSKLGHVTATGAVTEYALPSFVYPAQMTTGPDGNLWFTDTGGGSGRLNVYRVTPAGAITSFFAGTSTNGYFTSGAGITAGPDGNVWFVDVGAVGADQRTDRIGRITPAGVFDEFLFGPTELPFSITAGPDGNLWFTRGNRIASISPAGVLTQFSAGIPFATTNGAIAKGTDGNLWFTEYNLHGLGAAIARITPTGEVTQFSDGMTPGPASAITTGPDGNVWYANASTKRIGRVTPAGQITEFTAPIFEEASPRDITSGPDGNLWFTLENVVSSSNADRQIGRITTAGVVTEFSTGITAIPYKIAAGADGNLWFTETDRSFSDATAGIGRISTTGVVTEFRSAFEGGWVAYDITKGPDGNVWFTERNSTAGRIGRITPDGAVTHFSLGINAVTPASITTGLDGNLWVTGSGNQVFRVTPNGDVMTFSAGRLGRPARITTGSDGNLWFTEQDGDRVGRIMAVTTAIEFYNAALDHYFVTWMPNEIAKLDAGTEIRGWTRTGYSFNVSAIPKSATVPVCRYYIPPALGDSHFFGRDPAECSATRRKFPQLVLEDQGFMQMYLPTSGVCPANTTPVYRVFSNRADANHRYTTDRAVRDAMVAKGWLAEGDGPDMVVMCAPQ